MSILRAVRKWWRQEDWREIAGARVDEIRKLNQHIEQLQKDLTPLSVSLIRHLLGTVDLKDVRGKETEMSPEERKNYVARLSSNWDIVEKKIMRLIVAQEEYMARMTENQEQLMLGRGTINGLFLIHEELEQAFKEHMLNSSPVESFDKRKLFSEI